MTFVKNVLSGKFLAVNAGDGVNLIQFDFTGDGTQQWNFEQVSDGVFKIRNVGSGKVIDDPNSTPNAGTQLVVFDDHGGQNQLWRTGTLSDRPNSRFFQNVASGLFIDVAGRSQDNGAHVIQWTAFDNLIGQNQQWDLSN
jgi:alpha-L-fucosidase